VSEFYILDAEHNLIRTDINTWVKFCDGNERRVALDEIGEVRVSTVFLGMNHRWGEGPPLLFETMTFGPFGEYCWRYTSWEEALAGHQRVVEAIKAGTPLDALPDEEDE
jgi:hypothetical protein